MHYTTTSTYEPTPEEEKDLSTSFSPEKAKAIEEFKATLLNRFFPWMEFDNKQLDTLFTRHSMAQKLVDIRKAERKEASKRNIKAEILQKVLNNSR